MAASVDAYIALARPRRLDALLGWKVYIMWPNAMTSQRRMATAFVPTCAAQLHLLHKATATKEYHWLTV